MTTKKTARRARALAATVGAAVLATLGFAGTATAAPADPGLIDPTRETGNVYITKYQGDAGVEANGEEVTSGLPSDDDLLEGATFTLYRVNNVAGDFDLHTNAGWTATADLLAAVGPNPSMAALTAAGVTLGTPIAETTDADGVANFLGIDLGLYYAVETAPSGYLPVQPFLFTLPMTNSTGDGWNYDIYLYPKDDAGSTKVPLDEETVNVGDLLTWHIEAVIPADVSYLKVTDLLDPNLDFDGVTVTLDGTELDEGTHYTLTTTDVSGRTNVEVEFIDPAGIDALAAATARFVVIDVDTTVKDTFVSGSITNTADIFDNEGSTTPGSSTPETKSNYGTINVEKINEGGDPLEGAEFDIYWSSTPDFSDAVAITAKSGQETDVDGLASFEALRWSNWANGEEITAGDPGYIYYWLVETAAPNGYQTLAEPILVDLTANSVTEQVVNIERGAGIELPFTGGPGTLIFIIGGLALVAGTVFLAVSRKPKKDLSA